ncbi:hypothetical protein [Flavobacterium collinsii]|jgi:hypothetical protein|uniref:Uncharacterized protein n=1 Tax=Flavobacterium collinsii TaxID=1114861 RepID=A0ABN7EQG4_9FLAO|nr:hypothetical protein [Flavobacterium collinsii]CAA9200508.1 hypothetical protein FLACOL7796_03292 [Flavobacterium collinsii]
MKTIKQLNTFAVGLPFLILITYPIAKEGAFFFSLLSTILTGIIQVLIGIKMILKEPHNRYLQIYIIGVLLYFAVYFISSYFRIYQILNNFLLAVPPLLAIYLSVLIYKKENL